MRRSTVRMGEGKGMIRVDTAGCERDHMAGRVNKIERCLFHDKPSEEEHQHASNINIPLSINCHAMIVLCHAITWRQDFACVATTCHGMPGTNESGGKDKGLSLSCLKTCNTRRRNTCLCN